MTDSTVFLTREGFDMELSLEQVTPQVVARIFSVNIDTLWLRERGGTGHYIPNQSNTDFGFPDEEFGGLTTLVVEGRSEVSGTATTPTTATVSNSAVVASGSSRRPVMPLGGRRPAAGSISVKVMQATVKRNTNGRLIFRSVGLHFIDVTEATANVTYLNHAIKEHYGKEYVLVTSDGLKIEDSSGTKGLKFWKVGSRKVFAVKEKALLSKGKYPADSSSSSSDIDSDSLQPKAKVPRYDVEKDIKDIKKKILSLFNVEKSLNVPISLRNILIENFKCSICQGTMKPPVIFSRCCKFLIGCESCIDTWYETSRTCPRCRAERGFTETCRLNGIDEFLTAINKLDEPPARAE